jgi:dTDP-4-amino-4,6-dideoxygalactose transaminase
VAIFNSLGSNYRFKQVMQILLGLGDRVDNDQLVASLEQDYSGIATLTYKAREAMTLGFRELKLPESSKIIVNGYTCFAVEDSITSAGLTPVYADIDPSLFHFGLKELEQAYSEDLDSKVVVIQNTYGIGFDIKPIENFCKNNGLILIEDLAHSIGGTYLDGRTMGTIGDMVILSFGRDKVIDTVSGGALIDRRDGAREITLTKKISWLTQTVDRLYPLNTWKIRLLYPIKIGIIWQVIAKKIGLLPRAVDWPASVAHLLPYWYQRRIIYELYHMDDMLLHRREIAMIYQESLPKSMISPTLTRQSINIGTMIRYPALVKDPVGVLAALREQEIYLADIWYDAPIAPIRFRDKTQYKKSSCPNSEDLISKVINLPTHRNISTHIARKIVTILNEVEGKK